MGRGRSFLLAALVVATVGASAALAQTSATPPADGDGHPVIAYIGAVMTNVAYLPAKLCYAGIGGVVGGLAYLVSGGDVEAFSGIWQAAGHGTWLVTPSMLEGREPVRFRGP